MATRRYSVNPGDGANQVTEAAGAAIATKNVEVTIELATTAVNDGGATRTIAKSEVLDALTKIKEHITKGNWPPA